MVLVTWGSGGWSAGRAIGLAAAALLAISPLAVQYSQEVRMYALAGLLAAASSWAGLALLRALQDEKAGRWRLLGLTVGYGLLAAALLYTHYYGALVVAAQQLYAGLVLLLTRRWRIVPFCGLASGFAALLFLPWLPVALRQTGYYPGLGSPQPAWALALDAVNVLSIGIATTRFGFRAGLAPFLGLAALGARFLASRPLVPGQALTPQPPLPVRGRGAGGEGVNRVGGEVVFLLLWLLLPIAGIVVLSQSRPLYEPRFLMLVLAGLDDPGGRGAGGARRSCGPDPWRWPWAAPRCASARRDRVRRGGGRPAVDPDDALAGVVLFRSDVRAG